MHVNDLIFQDPEPNIGNSSEYIDMSLGISLYNESWWVGYGVFHLNRPSLNYITKDNLKHKHNLHAGYSISLNDKTIILPALLLQYQNPIFQIEMGTNFRLSNFLVGIWHRGLYDNGINSNSVNLVAGFQLKNFQLNYSYDFLLLNFNSAGANHEISIIINFLDKKKIICPSFYYRNY